VLIYRETVFRLSNQVGHSWIYQEKDGERKTNRFAWHDSRKGMVWAEWKDSATTALRSPCKAGRQGREKSMIPQDFASPVSTGQTRHDFLRSRKPANSLVGSW